ACLPAQGWRSGSIDWCSACWDSRPSMMSPRSRSTGPEVRDGPGHATAGLRKGASGTVLKMLLMMRVVPVRGFGDGFVEAAERPAPAVQLHRSAEHGDHQQS